MVPVRPYCRPGTQWGGHIPQHCIQGMGMGLALSWNDSGSITHRGCSQAWHLAEWHLYGAGKVCRPHWDQAQVPWLPATGTPSHGR